MSKWENEKKVSFPGREKSYIHILYLMWW